MAWKERNDWERNDWERKRTQLYREKMAELAEEMKDVPCDHIWDKNGICDVCWAVKDELKEAPHE